MNQGVLEELIRDMAAAGQTVIFSTHVMQHAERLCDQILLIAKGRKIFDGSVAQAKATIPRRILIETNSDISSLRDIDGIREILTLAANPVTGNAGQLWQLQIQQQVNPQLILKSCFDKGIALSRFEFTEPSLHDVFVHLVGDDAREHAAR